MKMVVTGGRGFIGSHFVELALSRGHVVVDIDCMTYCANVSLPFDRDRNYVHLNRDINEIQHLPFCDVVVNFAAETHVDNSITCSDKFVKSNVMGVHNLLELIRGKVYERPKFVQVSTDEVYGDRLQGSFKEEDVLSPSNPYSATKAAAEHLVTSYARTYGIDYLITRSSNNYGPRQYEEKLISKAIGCLRSGRKIPLHGDGSYMRDWIYVIDNVTAILDLIELGRVNQTYNVSGGLLLSNNQVIEQVCGWFGHSEWRDHVVYTENRLGQDLRYSISNEKLKRDGVRFHDRTKLFNFIEEK